MREKFDGAIFSLRECLFPFGCALCGAALLNADEAWNGLCLDCRTSLDAEFRETLERAAAGGTCPRCGRPLVSEIGTCLSCRAREEGSLPEGALALFPYLGKYKKLLGAYKFDKNIALGNFFAEKIALAIEAARQSFFDGATVGIVPVPPRPGKIRSAGWDQIELLARLLEKRRVEGAVAHRCLKRLKSKAQKDLGREGRRANLRGRIEPCRAAPEAAFLIDDVMTTGSTIEACARALREGGAKSVFSLCLFYD
ncbi:MAG: ComF family protein [Treponema sp.]|nr:ComF family protein [Treponema sp.]